MFKTRTLSAVLVVLALSGCSAAGVESAPEPKPSMTAEPAPSNTPAAQPTPTAAAAPIEIVPTEQPKAEFNGFSSQREWYLKSLEGSLSGTVSDDDLIAAGLLVCEQLASGVAYDEVRVVSGTGEAADLDNENIYWSAVQVYCPELG